MFPQTPGRPCVIIPVWQNRLSNQFPKLQFYLNDGRGVIHKSSVDTLIDRPTGGWMNGRIDWMTDWFYMTKEYPFQLVHCRAFLVAILNDARQKIVEIKFPVKKRVIIICRNFCFRNANLWQCFYQDFSRCAEEGGRGRG